MNKTCITYWLPIIQEAGLPFPRTEIVFMDKAMQKAAFDVMDCKPGNIDDFIHVLGNSCDKLGYPVFLRTGQGSGKHDWKRTCHLTRRDDLESHVYALIEWSETVDMMGIPWDVWCAREMLKTVPVCTLPAYGDFPLVPEVRCFIKGGDVVCHHPYWPENAVKEGFPRTDDWHSGKRDRKLPSNINDIVKAATTFDESQFMPLARGAAKAFAKDNAFSVDLLPTESGTWYLTDMAIASRSFHCEGCKRKGEL